MAREPVDIDQCVGCGCDVAVYSESQFTPDGDLLCSSCRAIHRQDRTRRARENASRAKEEHLSREQARARAKAELGPCGKCSSCLDPFDHGTRCATWGDYCTDRGDGQPGRFDPLTGC